MFIICLLLLFVWITVTIKNGVGLLIVYNLNVPDSLLCPLMNVKEIDCIYCLYLKAWNVKNKYIFSK